MNLIKDEKKLGKLKKGAIVLFGSVMILSFIKDYDNFTDFKNDLKLALLNSFAGITYEIPSDSTPLSELDLNEDVLYVHDNGKRQIISENKNINGYRNEGVYVPSDDDVIAYVVTTTGYGYESGYSTATNNEINTTYDYIDDEFAIIDENSPDRLSADISNTK